MQLDIRKTENLAENAKIDLSQYVKTTIDIDGLGNGDSGREILVSVEITRISLNN